MIELQIPIFAPKKNHDSEVKTPQISGKNAIFTRNPSITIFKWLGTLKTILSKIKKFNL